MLRSSRSFRIACGLAGIASASCGGDYWLGGGPAGASGAAGTAGSGAGGTGGSINNPTIHDLVGDIVVTGGNSREFSNCRIIGNGHSIRSVAPWYGSLWIHDCEIIGLGSATTRAIDVAMTEAGWTTVERSTFATSGAVRVTNQDDSTTTFADNVVFENSVVAIDESTGQAEPVFEAGGAGASPKVFRGNRIYRSGAQFSSPNWTIGGGTDRDSNLLIGLQAGLGLGAPGLVVRGNYVHNVHVAAAGDDSTLGVAYGTTDVLAEHNVLRRGTWVVRGFGGELRYNALLDADDLAWIQQPFENTRVHHNVFLMCHAPDGRVGIQGGIQLVNNRTSGIEIYNNTLDGGGGLATFSGPVISVDSTSFLDSVRSNLIHNFRLEANGAIIGPHDGETLSPAQPRLGYADYNLFFTPATPTRNYALSVQNLVERVDPGFAFHDAHVGGVVDQQVDPRLTGASEGCFPWSDDDIKARRVTVSQMLAYWRTAYTPLSDSPLRAGGDPADGAGNAIGAVGDGALAADAFGRFGR
jgi:hypothetical protein